MIKMLVRMPVLSAVVMCMHSATPLMRMQGGRLGAHVVDKRDAHR